MTGEGSFSIVALHATPSLNPKTHIAHPLHLRLGLLLTLICLSAAETLAAPQKVRVRDKSEADAMIARGGKFIADYGSFQLIETDEQLPPVRLRELRTDDSDVIELNARRLNTRTTEVRSLRKSRSPFSGKKFHLIQFAGPVKPEWREALERYGVKVAAYIPQNAYLVHGDAQALARLQSWAGATNIVQWEGDYADDYKIDPAARPVDAAGAPRVIDTDLFAVQLIEDVEANPATLTLIDRLKLSPVSRQFQTLEFINVIVRLPANLLTNVSARPDVISIQPYVDPQPRDERQDQIIAGNISGSAPNGPGYLAWLTGKGFEQAQFDASAFAVDITDSGVDNGTTTPGHFGLYTGGNPFAASRVIYNRVEGTPHGGSTAAGCDGHGTLNAHIIMGYNNSAAGFPHTDSAGYRYGLGVCPFVKLGSSVIFDPDLFTSPNYANLQSKAYQDGARISANSWGATNNTYTVDSQSYDSLVRDAQPTGSTFAAPDNQQMVIVFAAGNKGSAANTVGSPGTGKNVITVGASENVRSLSTANGGNSAAGGDGCGLTDSGADNLNDIASFSSRGPCHDGRQKPDIVAPGTHVIGGVGQTSTNATGNGSAIACFKATGVCALSGGGTVGSTNNFFPLGQQFYTVSSGTSHSTPAVAGACALLRQYFINTNLVPPSPAMTKAYLMNSTRYLTGVSANDNLWSPNQGMGELNLGTAFDGTPRVMRDQLPNDKFTATGQTRTFTVSIVDTNKPFRVTLAWTDAPGSTTGNAFNNDLDLTATLGGNTYKGNVFSGASSATGGSADARNNVENIFLPAGVSGTVVVTVSAANINSDGVPNESPVLDQDFALVIYNASGVAVSGYSVPAESCFPTNGAVDVNETVTVNFSLINSGTTDVTNLTATLLATNGVLLPSGPQNYGTLTAGGAATIRPFTFTASGSCGGSITATLQIKSGAADIGTVTQVIPIGNIVVLNLGFTNSASITIPDNSAASIYPSTITVAGVTGTVTKVTASLRGLTHTFPDDLDVLLVGPTGTNVMLISDCGDAPDINGITLIFDDTASASLPNSSQIVAGTWKPTNIGTGSDNFAAPAPTNGLYGSLLSAFTNQNPNGTWSLYIRDDSAGDFGSLTQGWTLSITTSNIYCCNSALNTANLGVSQSASVPVLNVGTNVTLSVIVTNRGADPCAFVTLTNTIPPELNFVSATTSQGTFTNVAGVVTCSLGIMAANSSATLTIEAAGVIPGPATNRASVGGGTFDPNTVDNTSALALAVNAFPSISHIPYGSTSEDVATGDISFTVQDAETPASALSLGIISSDTNLLPLTNITLGGSGTNRTLNILPATNQSGSATITITADDGLALSAYSFELTVIPVNDPPTLAPVADFTVLEGDSLLFTNAASDIESPTQSLAFTLLAAPAGATVNSAGGEFNWTPSEAQGPGTNLIVVMVTDDGAPGLSATQSFTVVVLETNQPPVLSPVSNLTVVAGQTLVHTNIAMDADEPPNNLLFTLDGAPTNAVINPTNGVFSWLSDEYQPASTNVFLVIVTDDGTPSLSATQSVTVLVTASNHPPVLAAISDVTIIEGGLLVLTNVANDSDPITNTLVFSLFNAPTNAVINPTNGIFEWTPDESQGPATNVFEVVVTDDGIPSLSATQSFAIVVLETNVAPVLDPIPNLTVVEGFELTFTNVASDADLPPNQLLFSLESAPTNAAVNPANGVFSWTPSQSQAPSTNLISLVVGDDGVPGLSATQSFTVVVLATNHPPSLAAISNFTIVEGELLSFTNFAADVDVPGNVLTFSFAGAPTNAFINATNGEFSWTPDELHGPGTNVIEVIVTDDGVQALSATQSFTVIVLESNQPPVLQSVSNLTILEGVMFSMTNVATDGDFPANVLVFAMTGAPTNALLDTTNGVFTWTPAEEQSPSTNLVEFMVTDDGVPAFSATQLVSIVVMQSNRPPVLAPINDRTVHAGSQIQFTNTATDPNLPPDALTFSLDPGSPVGASVSATTGVFIWQTSDSDAATTNSLTVRVTDDRLPPLSDAKSFVVSVVARPTITSLQVSNEMVHVTWTAIAGQSYQLQTSTNLAAPGWIAVTPDVTASSAEVTHTNQFDAMSPQFYRVKVQP